GSIVPLSLFVHSPSLFSFNPPSTPTFSTLSLHDALPISPASSTARIACSTASAASGSPSPWRNSSAADAIAPIGFAIPCPAMSRSEEHTSELQSLRHLVCRLLLEKKKTYQQSTHPEHVPY